MTSCTTQPQHLIVSTEPCTAKADETALDWLLYQQNGTTEKPRTMRQRADAFFCFSSTASTSIGSHGSNNKMNLNYGTGISFVDEVFRSQNMSMKQKSGEGMFLEISGSGQTGKTFLMLQLAASYLLATDIDYEGMKDSLKIQDQFSYFGFVHSSAPPNVVIFDLEYGIVLEQLVIIIRAMILRAIESDENDDQHVQKVDRCIVRLLGRINIVRPRDNSDLVSALESLRFSLDSTQKAVDKESAAPLLLLIDSIGAFEQRDHMLEVLGNPSCPSKNSSNSSRRNGLSGAGDFKRQLQRLRNCTNQKIAIFATRYTGRYTSSLNKVVTHRLCLDRVKHGTPEERSGFSFVALYSTGSTYSKMDVCSPFSIRNNAGIVTTV